MHYELKWQKAHDYIAQRHHKHYADQCMLDCGMLTFSRENPSLNVRELAEAGMARDLVNSAKEADENAAI